MGIAEILLPNPANLVNELAIAALLFVYVMGVIGLTKVIYHAMRKRGVPHNVAVYYNRKIIHMSAGGFVAILVPFVFTSPLIPFVAALLLALMTYIPHRKGKLMYWFQVEDNMYEVNFCIVWGTSLLILWLIFQNPNIAILPPLLISFGDAVTGIVRNAVFGRRTKHWIGNVAMAAVTIPIGIAFASIPGGIASLAATIVERYEFNPIDDNVLIGLTSTVILLIAHALGAV